MQAFLMIFQDLNIANVRKPHKQTSENVISAKYTLFKKICYYHIK